VPDSLYSEFALGPAPLLHRRRDTEIQLGADDET